MRRLAREGADGAQEIIVADGGSSDRTCELSRAAGARVVHCERGRGLQLAAGARGARGDLLLFLHADSMPTEGALERIRAAFDADDVIASGMCQRILAQRKVYRWIEHAADARVSRKSMVYGDSGLCVRRQVYEELGGFSDWPIFEDVDMSERLRKRGKVVLVPGAHLEISARRWERGGVVICTARNWLLTLAYKAGISPRRLAGLYPPHKRRASPLAKEIGEPFQSAPTNLSSEAGRPDGPEQESERA